MHISRLSGCCSRENETVSRASVFVIFLGSFVKDTTSHCYPFMRFVLFDVDKEILVGIMALKSFVSPVSTRGILITCVLSRTLKLLQYLNVSTDIAISI